LSYRGKNIVNISDLYAFSYCIFVIAYRHLIPYDIWCYDKLK
jgi:hypothetical protein